MTWSNVKIALVTVLVSTGIAVISASLLVNYEKRSERRQRDAAIALAVKVQHRADVRASEIGYRNQLASCRRGIGLRLTVRALAKADARVYHVLGGFLKGARPRAAAQSRDPNISARSRIAALHSLTSIDDGIVALSVRLKIPPKPQKCIDVIKNPNAPPSTPRHH